MRKQLTIIPADPGMAPYAIEAEDDLDTLRANVGGDIEHIPAFKEYNGRHCNVYANQDGQRLDLPINEGASELWTQQLAGRSLRYAPILRGPIVVVQSIERESREAAGPVRSEIVSHKKKHGEPFAKTKRGSARRAERLFNMHKQGSV